MSRYRYTHFPELTFRSFYESALEYLKKQEEVDKNVIRNNQFKLREIKNHFITRSNKLAPAQISIKQSQISIKQYGMGVDPYKLKNRHYKK